MAAVDARRSGPGGVLLGLSHPPAPRSYLVMPFMGTDLGKLMKHETLSEDRIQFLVYQMLKGLKVRACGGRVGAVPRLARGCRGPGAPTADPDPLSAPTVHPCSRHHPQGESLLWARVGGSAPVSRR